jgi:hypothetical protein
LYQNLLVSEPLVSEPLVSEPLVSEPLVSEPLVSEPRFQFRIVYRLNKMNCELMLTYDTPAYIFFVGKNASHNMAYLSDFCHLIIAEKNATKNILDGRPEVKQYTLPPVERGYN